MTRSLTVAALLLCVACRSDEAKLQQLRDRVDSAIRDSARAQAQFDSVFRNSNSSQIDSVAAYMKRAEFARNRLSLARRDLNRFLK